MIFFQNPSQEFIMRSRVGTLFGTGLYFRMLSSSSASVIKLRETSFILWLRAASLKSFHNWEMILTSTVVFRINNGYRTLSVIWGRNGILACFPHNIFASVVYCGISLSNKPLIHLDKWHATKRRYKEYPLLATDNSIKQHNNRLYILCTIQQFKIKFIHAV